ncbi:MAG: beta-galactosidase BgaS [Candidatus Caldarchaeales archaeon]|nr:beta-galactosidase BgaS [Candidatus Caldarchaeales archaeon]
MENVLSYYIIVLEKWIRCMFRRDFMWGFSEAGFQFEMGYSPEAVDKNTDWYVWVTDPLNILNRVVSGDRPEDGPGYWDLYKTDHDLIQRMGANTMRIGVEWSRIFPKPTREVEAHVTVEDGVIKSVEIPQTAAEQLEKLANKSAVMHYRDMLKDLRDRGFKVILNLNHFTQPIWVHDPIRARASALREGPTGWADPSSVVEFVKYAHYAATAFSDLVDMWSTFNEPFVVTDIGYGRYSSEYAFPPGFFSIEALMRARLNLICAHARGYDELKKVLGKNSTVGVIYATSAVEPLNKDDPEDKRAAELLNHFSNLWFFETLTKGELDRSMMGLQTPEKVPELKDKIDWIGVNYYSRIVARKPRIPGSPMMWDVVPGYGFACAPESFSAVGRPTSEFGWEIYPEGLRNVLNMLSRYGKPMIVTENGTADRLDRLRSQFLFSHIAAIEDAVKAGADVRGYLHWSFIDNFEWARGFSMRFGVITYDPATKKRRARPSYYIFRDIIQVNGLDQNMRETAELLYTP